LVFGSIDWKAKLQKVDEVCSTAGMKLMQKDALALIGKTAAVVSLGLLSMATDNSCETPHDDTSR